MKKYLAIVILLFAFAFVGCTDDAPLLEYGFNSNATDPQNSYKCGYVLPQTEFEKDNVFIDVYYGEIDGGNLGNGQTMRLYFMGTETTDPWYEDENVFLIKELNGEEFNSDKYIWQGKEGYHERMKVPEELFDRQEGSITFIMIFHDDTMLLHNDGFGSLCSARVNFVLDGDVVTLTVPTK